MKRLMTVLALLGICTFAAAINLGTNPSFETGDLSGWQESVFPQWEASFLVGAPSAGAKDGASAVRLTNTDGIGVAQIYQFFPVSPGDEVYLSVSMLAETALVDGDSWGVPKITFLESPGAALLPASDCKGGIDTEFPGLVALPRLDNTSPANTWVFAETQGVAPPDTTQAFIELNNVNFTGAEAPIWFDDVFLDSSPTPNHGSRCGLANIGNVQTFGDGATEPPIVTDGSQCLACVYKGWWFDNGNPNNPVGGGPVYDVGENGTGDHAISYEAGADGVTPTGFHFGTWIGGGGDPNFVGSIGPGSAENPANYVAAGVYAVRFKAAHIGNGDNVALRATIFDTFKDGSFPDNFDVVVSDTAVEIAPSDDPNDPDPLWQTYTIPLLSSDVTAFGWKGALNDKTPDEILSGVVQFGLRHDPAKTGPGNNQNRVIAGVFFDDIELLVDGDGIANDIDTEPSVFSADFSDSASSGTVVQDDSELLFIVDEPDPAGVRMSAGLGRGSPARVSVCDSTATLIIKPHTDLVVTCGSVVLDIESGPAVTMEIILNGEPATVSVPANNTVAFEPGTAALTVTADPSLPDPEPVVLSVGGSEIPITPGDTLLRIGIDIKPGDDANSINLQSEGNITVAILSTDTFDALHVDWETVRFGPADAVESHGSVHVEDVDDDGDMDRVFHFKAQAPGIGCNDTDASLTGQTYGGDIVNGSDSIRIVKCPK